jgi:hypothetical protein
MISCRRSVLSVFISGEISGVGLVGPVGFELEAFWWRLSHQPKS